MDFWKTLGVLLRRWYVGVPVFVVSLLLGGGVYLQTPTQYESTGTIVLTAPTAGAVTALNPAQASGPGNPLLDFQGSLTITTQLLIQSLSSPAVHDQITSEGGSKTYQAGDGQTGGPFVVIVADANSPALAELTVNLTLKYAQNELDARQKNLNAPPTTFIGTQSVVSPTTANTKISGKVKAGGIALVAGLVVSLLAAYGIESWSSSRRRRRADKPDEELSAELEPEDDDESGVPTKKMIPVAPPRNVPAPQPVRAGGPRPTPHPVSVAQRESLGLHQPKPRPTPVPTNGSGKGTNSSHDWPAAEFPSPDLPTG